MKILVSIVLTFLLADASHASNLQMTGRGIEQLRIGQPAPVTSKTNLIARTWETGENGDRFELLVFGFNGVNVEAEVHDRRVWRLSISDPGIATVGGVSVGANAGATLRKNSAMTPAIGPGPGVELISNRPCGLSYVTDADVPYDFTVPLTRANAAPLLATAKITRIYATGCN